MNGDERLWVWCPAPSDIIWPLPGLPPDQAHLPPVRKGYSRSEATDPSLVFECCRGCCDEYTGNCVGNALGMVREVYGCGRCSAGSYTSGTTCEPCGSAASGRAAPLCRRSQGNIAIRPRTYRNVLESLSLYLGSWSINYLID